MTKLTSKIQYITFETGEFIDEQERSYEDTTALIETFPWKEQRQKIVIGLTNPSVTIHGHSDDFLKIAPYFNGKLVIYYLKGARLFKKVIMGANEARPYVEQFFQTSPFDTSDFRKENTLLQRNQKHFLSQDFYYELTTRRFTDYLLATSSMSFLFTIIIVLFALPMSGRPLNIPVIGMLAVILFFLGGGINLILIINYYRYSSKKLLVMSKGNQRFLFGHKGHLTSYSKADILGITVSQVKSSKNPLHAFAVISLELNNGMDLQIPNMLIDTSVLLNKLPGIPKQEENRFPIIRL